MSRSGSNLVAALHGEPLFEQRGRIVTALGTTITVRGISGRVGDSCRIVSPSGEHLLWAEIIGLHGEDIILTPLGELRGISPDSDVVLRSGRAEIPCGDDLLGRVFDARMNPLDGLGPVAQDRMRPLDGEAPNPLDRAPISSAMESGIRAIDGLMTIGTGQRIGVFASAGCGKSTLMGLLARQAKTDAIVIALIGERGREVREFIEDVLGEEGLARSVLIASTSDRPAMERVRAPALPPASPKECGTKAKMSCC